MFEEIDKASIPRQATHVRCTRPGRSGPNASEMRVRPSIRDRMALKWFMAWPMKQSDGDGAT
jgi:hypothetical protein